LLFQIERTFHLLISRTHHLLTTTPLGPLLERTLHLLIPRTYHVLTTQTPDFR